jgi:phthiodiolone/phenolphthiodiolone dimycocerosates ketoreductase
MSDHLAVGVETNCTAPMKLEHASTRLAALFGVDSLFLPDHYLSFIPRSVWGPELTPAAKMVPSPDAYFDPFVMMGAMAARHRRVRIGTGVTEPFRRHPATLAHRLWASGGEPVDFDGTIWRLRRARFATPMWQDSPPPIWVAAHAPRMLGVTGRFADGWYPTMKMTPADYAARLARIHAAAAEAGRSSARFEPALQIQLALGRDRRSVLDTIMRVPAAGALAMLLPGPLWAKHGLRHPLGERFEGFPDFVPEEVTPAQIDDARRQLTPALLQDGIFAGSVDEVVTELRPLVDAGLRHVIIWNIGPVATGASASDIVRLGLLVRRLRRLPLPPRQAAGNGAGR